MNADIRRQAMNNSGGLYDFDGPTSLGSLPYGELQVRTDSLIMTSPVRASNAHPFEIGAAPRTQLLPDDWLERGNQELSKRNLAELRKQGAGTRFGTGSEKLTAPPINVKVASVPTNMAGSGGREE